MYKGINYFVFYIALAFGNLMNYFSNNIHYQADIESFPE